MKVNCLAFICQTRSSLDMVHLRRDAFGIHHFLEHMDHVVELTMDVADDNDGLLDSEHVSFIAYNRESSRDSIIDLSCRVGENFLKRSDAYTQFLKHLYH